MGQTRRYTRSDQWLQQIFDSRAAREGMVVRRQVSDIEREVGWHRFTAEIERRGFRAVENCGHVVIFCNDAPIRPVVPNGQNPSTKDFGQVPSWKELGAFMP